MFNFAVMRSSQDLSDCAIREVMFEKQETKAAWNVFARVGLSELISLCGVVNSNKRSTRNVCGEVVGRILRGFARFCHAQRCQLCFILWWCDEAVVKSCAD